MDNLEEAIEIACRMVPGSGPYMLEVQSTIEDKHGPGSFEIFLSSLILLKRMKPYIGGPA